MTTYNPHRWVILEISSQELTVRKVFAGWRGGFADGDSWKLSSGIIDADTDSKLNCIVFKNESGSHYICHRETEGMTMYMSEIYQTWLDSVPANYSIKVIDSNEFLKTVYF